MSTGIIFGIIATVIYTVALILLIKLVNKQRDDNTFVNVRTGIKIKLIKRCGYYDEEDCLLHPGYIIVMLNNPDESLNNCAIAIKDSIIKSKYITLAEYNEQEKLKC